MKATLSSSQRLVRIIFTAILIIIPLVLFAGMMPFLFALFGINILDIPFINQLWELAMSSWIKIIGGGLILVITLTLLKGLKQILEKL